MGRNATGEDVAEVARAHGMVDHHAGRQQAHVADSVGDKSPQRRSAGRATLVEEADQHRRGDAKELPPREQDVDAPGEHHQVHPGAE